MNNFPDGVSPNMVPGDTPMDHHVDDYVTMNLHNNEMMEDFLAEESGWIGKDWCGMDTSGSLSIPPKVAEWLSGVIGPLWTDYLERKGEEDYHEQRG